MSGYVISVTKKCMCKKYVIENHLLRTSVEVLTQGDILRRAECNARVCLNSALRGGGLQNMCKLFLELRSKNMYEVLEILQFLEIFLELDQLGILGGIKKKKRQT